MTKARVPKYAGLVMRHGIDAGYTKGKPGVHHVEVQHEKSCKLLKTYNGMDCDCNPSIISGPKIQKKYDP